MPAILIVDDLISIHEMLAAVIQPTGHAVEFATDGERALVAYKAGRFDVVLADIDMKPMDGLTLLKHLKQYDPGCVVVIMTAYASTESAIQALKFGAFDYLQKPFRVDELMATLKRAVEFKRLAAEREAAGGAAPATRAGDIDARLVGTSPQIRRLAAQLKKIASAHTPVLVAGEPGAGHDLVAELLHAAGQPAGSPLVVADARSGDAAAVAEGLFGRAPGGGRWIQQAQGGTLVLHGIEALDRPGQEKLVGVLRSQGVGFRLVCTTEADLEKLTEEGAFNEELFYRIAPLPVQLPALRERVEDLPLLLRDVASRASSPRFDARQIEFADDALAVLRAYAWPRNLAEFQQVVSQILATSETRVVTAAQLPLRLRDVRDWPTLADFLAEQERRYIARVLQACGGDKARAAAALGVPPERLG
jgi:DNA-binding NtrC family response regulator